MSQAKIIDLAAREPTRKPAREPVRDPVREPARDSLRDSVGAPAGEPAGPDEGTVLSVVPIPGAEAALIIVGRVVPLPPPVPGTPPPSGPPPAYAHDAGTDGFVVDRSARVVRVDGDDIELTYREFELLDFLCSAPGRVYTRRQIMAAVWDRYGDESARTVDVHILRLRRKLGRHAGRVVTVRNVGYKFQGVPRRA
ncbi:winged helix-turn-helix domain-containing protein [Microtetraspora niveoalba]|uniref:winged helix-turn-helix domain-containing protein n=1 Tax=Microtetraspora niveoalba TaxID=46175 RepID=UPI0008354B20|nr:winged helix-turn-helix domain-containing protein [Microtetraspora niveoalba]